MAFLIGVVLACAVALFARLVGLDRDRAFYATVMVVIALLYDLFAVMGGSMQALGMELLVSAGFIAVTVLGFKRNMWLVAAALAGHGLFDFLHPHLYANPGVPDWWPTFCGAYDVMAAIVLAWMLRQGKYRN